MNSPPGFHFDKTINLGDLITTLVFAGGVFLYVTTLDKRVTVVESQQTQQQRTDAKQDESAEKTRAQLDKRLDAIDGKLDKLIEGKSAR